MGHYTCFLQHMEIVPGRPKVENLPNQSIVNKVHLTYPRAEKLKNQKNKIKPPPFLQAKPHPKRFSSEPTISLKC